MLMIETEEQAQEALAALRAFYRQPVQPVSRYCQAFREWIHALGERVVRDSDRAFPGLKSPDPAVAQQARDERERARGEYRAHGIVRGLPAIPGRDVHDRNFDASEFFSHEHQLDRVDAVRLMVSKSNMLARLIYGGEHARTEMCPEHQGRWSGIEFDENVCPHGCQLTGWLQHDLDRGSPRQPMPGPFVVRAAVHPRVPDTVEIRDPGGRPLGTVKMEPAR